MKRALLFSLAGLSLLLSQAQDLPDSMTFSRSDTPLVLVPVGMVYFDYDANGRVLTRVLSNNGFGSSKREEYVYDANGRELQYKRLWKYLHEPAFKTEDSISYQYNADQLLVKRVSYFGYHQTDTLTFSFADSFVYGMDLNNRVNYREEYFALEQVAGAMNWKEERRDSIFYDGSDTLPGRINGYKWNQDSGMYIHTVIQDSLRWKLAWDFGNNFYASDADYYERDSLGIFQHTGRRFTTGPSGRIESQVILYNFQGSGLDTVIMYVFAWDSKGLMKLKKAYYKSSGVLKFSYSVLDSMVYTFDRVTARYLLYENPTNLMAELYDYHYSTTGLADIGRQIPGFFPNPVRQGQHLYLQPETEVLSIVTLSGQEKTEWSYDGQRFWHNLAPGIYLMKLQQGERTNVQRLQVIP